MNISRELLLENGKYAGVILGLVLLLTLLGTGLFVRGASWLLRSKVLDTSPDLVTAFRRKTWRFSLGLVSLFVLLVGAGVVWASLRQLRFGELVQSRLAQLQSKDWLSIVLAAAKSLGVVVLAFLVARVVVAILAALRARLERTEVLTSHRDRLSALLEHLRLALLASLVFVALGVCAQLLKVSASGLRTFS